MINLSNVNLRRGTELLLQDCSLILYDERRLALVGRNGCGKSSLFELILGRLSPDQGEVNIPANCRIAHMAQEVAETDRSALDYVIDGHQQLRTIQSAIAEAESKDDHNQLSNLYEQLELVGGYAAEHQAAELLHGLGFAATDIQNPVNSFSGGWRIRLNLAQALMMPSDVLLLDEPTNHLDLDTSYWLEQRLKRYTGTLVVISHDRDFIDSIAQEIVHIEQRQLNLYRGNYSAFEQQRIERLALQQANYLKQQRQIKHIQSFIERFKAKATKAKQAQSRVKQLANMEKVASAQVDSPFKFSFISNPKISNPLVNLRDTQLGYGELRVLQQLNLNLSPGDRVGLLGVNGAGKSTLIKSLTGDLPLIAGQRFQGDNCHIGYFAQHQIDMLDPDENAIWHIQRISPEESEQKVRNFLGGFDFHGDKATDSIAPFSGGEKTRLALAMLVWQKPNLLLLDEPTNHLDLDMRAALTLALQDFEGALVVVSHDRHLLRHSVDQYLLVHDGLVEPFDGTLDDYHRMLSSGGVSIPAPTAAPKAKLATAAKDTTAANSDARKNANPGNQANRHKTRSSLKNRIKRVELKMEETARKLAEVEEKLGDNALYQSENRTRLEDLIYRQAELKQEFGSLEDNWLELSETLDAQ